MRFNVIQASEPGSIIKIHPGLPALNKVEGTRYPVRHSEAQPMNLNLLYTSHEPRATNLQRFRNFALFPTSVIPDLIWNPA